VQSPTWREVDPSMTPSQRMRAALHERAVAKPLVAWGIGNVILTLLQMFLAPIGPLIGINIGDLNKYFMFSFGAWIAVVLLKKAAPLRIPIAMVFLILVQVWFTVSTFMAQIQMGRHMEFIAPDYSLVTFLLAFIQGAMLVQMAPELRKTMAKGLIALCLISAFVAMLQFLNVGPAIAFANIMVGLEDITNWAGQGGVRAVGVFPGVILPVHYNLIVIGIVAAALFYRKLNAAEITLIVVLIGVMLMSQVRNATVLIALVLLPLIVLFVKRHRYAALPYVVAGVVVLIVMIFFGGDRFQYLFSGDTSTFDYRREVLWPQAYNIVEQRPWFGIGVEPAMAGFQIISADRWTDAIIMDNGYLVTMSFGGIPALTFLIIAVVAAILGAGRLVLRKTEDRWEKGYAVAALVVALAFGYGMLFGNMITNISLGMFYFIVAGMGMPTERGESLRAYRAFGARIGRKEGQRTLLARREDPELFRGHE
jgi:O-antigen ligase